MARDQSTSSSQGAQGSLDDLEKIFQLVDHMPIWRRLQYRRIGRTGYHVGKLFRAYLASFVLNLPSTNALIRALHDQPRLRELCRFEEGIPHRTTFNRFIKCLSNHISLVEAACASVVTRLKDLLPDFARNVAVDSTKVRTHSNPDKPLVSDPDATWTGKAKRKDGKTRGTDYHFGYKLHMLMDANYGVPIAFITTTAKVTDFSGLPMLVDRAGAMLPRFKPYSLSADRGYDSYENHNFLADRGIAPIIKVKGQARPDLYEGLYTREGTPTCLGRVPMEYVKSDPNLGRLYMCQPQGCHLKGTLTGGTRHCDTRVWEDPKQDVRFFGGAVRRDGPEWKELYRKRQAVERLFKSMKESRRLERHYVRGMRQVTLHNAMATLATQVTCLSRVVAGQAGEMRWMVRQVA